ncbi:hypothetical protein PspLS_10073, partial [Pyricularia sp. CBS 133598]
LRKTRGSFSAIRTVSNLLRKIIAAKYFRTKPRIWWRELLQIVCIIYNIYPTR